MALEFLNITASRGTDGVYSYGESGGRLRYVKYSLMTSLEMGLIMTDNAPFVQLVPKRHAVEIPFTNGTRDISSAEAGMVFEYAHMKYTFISVIDTHDINGGRRTISDISKACLDRIESVTDWLCHSGTNYRGLSLFDSGLNKELVDCCCEDIRVKKDIYPDAWIVTFEITFHYIPDLLGAASEVHIDVPLTSDPRYIIFGSFNSKTLGLFMTDETELSAKEPKLSFVNVRTISGGINTSFKTNSSPYYYKDLEARYSFIRPFRYDTDAVSMTRKLWSVVRETAEKLFQVNGANVVWEVGTEKIFGGVTLWDSASQTSHVGARCTRLTASAEFEEDYWILHLTIEAVMYPL